MLGLIACTDVGDPISFGFLGTFLVLLVLKELCSDVRQNTVLDDKFVPVFFFCVIEIRRF